jgi:uncharacterized repeat protein (TIGR03803 family)
VRNALPILCCGILLASCARGGESARLLPALSLQSVQSPNSAYAKLYSFLGTPSGAQPMGLTLMRGAMYGTTMSGGANTFGSVFTRGATGKVRTLYSFRGGTDGATPQGTLVVLNGTLYGTTEFGGKYGNGTVFQITAGGKERVLYAFKGGNDGATPAIAGMVAVNGVLYGTTSAGGNSKCSAENSVGCGIVFAVTTSGKESVLYRFKGKPDAAIPSGTLIAVNGTIYGTTNLGGPSDDGTAFKITTSGAEHVIYAFRGYPDGAVPYGGLTPFSGAFYGTTAFGGAFGNSGTIFKLTPAGSERILHSFSGFPDGAVPVGMLTASSSLLYGTTAYGGNSGRNCTGGGITGCGMIFSIGASGPMHVLYRFRGQPDGANPWASLTLSNGSFYGTTISGGAKNFGTIFKIATSSQ